MPAEIQINQKDFASVKEMAAMLQMSRSRLHMLIRDGVFLPPVYDLSSKRPYFPRELIETNLDARRRNCGVNGRPVCFYSPRAASLIVPRRSSSRSTTASRGSTTPRRHAALAEGLAALGVEATDSQIEIALAAAFPNDRGASADEGLRLRECFRSLRQRPIPSQDSTHNVG